MKLLVVFSALVCLCAAQTDSDYNRAPSNEYEDPAPSSYDTPYHVPTYNQGASYVPTTYGRYAPTYGSYGYDYHRDSYAYERDQRILERLEALNALLDTREAIADAQFERVAGLRDSANENVDFANNFKEYIHPEISNEQHQQNSRLDRLEERIAELQAIRGSVEELNVAADAADEQLNEEREQNTLFHTELKEIRNGDYQKGIDLIQQREDFVALRVDRGEDSIAENTRSLDILETLVRRSIDSVNRRRAHEEDVVIDLNMGNGTSVVDFEPPFVGAPQFNAASVVGGHLSNPSSYVQYGYPTIYGGTEEELWNIRTEISANDMSSGNFHLNEVSITTDNIYFDNIVYTKDAFDGIVTEYFEF